MGEPVAARAEQFWADVARLSQNFTTGEPLSLFAEMRRVREKLHEALEPVAGLGFVPFGNAVHYAHRRKSFQSLMAKGELPPVGYATDVGAGLHYRGAEMAGVIADRANAAAYRVERTGTGVVRETVLEARRLR